jgi:4-hydroxy-tetrahydrodipicolinate synthase
MSLTGLFVPLVTPFTAADDIASDALEALAHAVLDGGAAGIVALGTTAEPATLTSAERRRVVDICAGVCVERGAPLIVGAGSNSTAGAVDLLADLDPRAAAALAVVPYDATVAFMSSLPADIAVLGGDDLYAGPLLALGASGAILACANVATRAYADLVNAWRDGPLVQARQLGNRLVPLARALFAEPNPVVIKAVLAAHGRIPSAHVRLPLLASSPAATEAALECCPTLGRAS